MLLYTCVVCDVGLSAKLYLTDISRIVSWFHVSSKICTVWVKLMNNCIKLSIRFGKINSICHLFRNPETFSKLGANLKIPFLDFKNSLMFFCLYIKVLMKLNLVLLQNCRYIANYRKHYSCLLYIYS